ncbi:MAG TPA: hypothetical protein PK892_00620 [Bacteroidales bacterium]|nr:hypothetical protein [Bacteroidales bacterium]
MVAIGILILLLISYIFIIRPWHLKWGATEKEVSLSLPGDDIVKKPDFNATRGISIAAPPHEIWKWIIQIGSKKAGWYSIDWMDNGGIQSSFVILPEFQKIEIGQFIPFTPDQKNGMWVKEFKLNEFILWTDKTGKATWLWYLYINENNETRLITRLKTNYVWNSLWIIYYLIYDIGDIIMMTKCMKGIKKRAESGNKSD